ncbi:methyltransferase domain-containing protein [Roseibium sp.]|uniref:methyltransferase domain-containing protein n=1 Tax=Roseibium sp. TaxID=1936156 RepID=UPI003A96F916
MSQPDPFDRSLLAQHRRRALATPVDGADFLAKEAAVDLEERLAALSREFELAVDLSGHGDHVARVLQASPKIGTVLRADLFAPLANFPAPDFVFDDACPPLKPATFNLAVSLLSLQFVNDLPGSLVQIRQALKPDGLFLGMLVGGDSLFELRDALMRAELELIEGASPRVMPFADVRDMGALMQRAGFALPVTDMDRITVRYANMFGLMRDLKAMGASSILKDRSRKPVSKGFFLRAAELYAEHHSDPDGRIRATFSLISLSGWAPHESQQKPLRPGSAKTRLADALSTQETPLKG